MFSPRRNNDAFESSIEESETDDEISINRLNNPRPSFVPRQISFSQRRATFGEILLVILPYLVLLFDIFIFFLLRGFKLNSFDGSLISYPKSNN